MEGIMLSGGVDSPQTIERSSKIGSTFVLGMGNPILGDDGVGCRIASEIDDRLKPGTATVFSTSFSLVRIVDEIANHDKLIAIDSITTGEHPPGTLLEIEILDEQYEHAPISQLHFSIGSLIDMGGRLGLNMPEEIVIYGVEIEPALEFKDTFSPIIEKKLPEYINEILEKEFTNHDAEALERRCSV